MFKKYNLFLITAFIFHAAIVQSQPIPAAETINEYITLLKGRRVGLVVNQTSMVKSTHLSDTLLALKINVKRIFGPEHGFRGNADAGEKVNNTSDTKTGIPVVSLYGKNKKPLPEQLSDLDVVVFDIQDVGVRFYTYISTLHYVMEACAENGKPLIVLDRPNPNGMYVNGPVLDTAFRSFVGMHPVPVVYGLTIGEYAQMINGEKWYSSGTQAPNGKLIPVRCALTVIRCKNYTHKSFYSLPVKPSPNLPNDLSIALYPSLCLFEGTNVSVARGTYFPFQAIGFPDSTYGGFYFTPESIPGMAKEPMHMGKKCYGSDLRNIKPNYVFSLSYVMSFYNRARDKEKYFNNFFNKLAGTDQLMKQIKEGKPEEEIRRTWQPKLDEYKKTRKKYLLYTDFE